MSDPSTPTPFYIRSGARSTFAVYHPAAAAKADPAKPAVLFSPPWGWEDVSSYRARRDWAGRLAAAGFPTLRFDLPATGNSSGEVDDDQLCSEWVAAVAASAAWLAGAQEAAGVATFGFGLGGLLALQAVISGAPITALALWGTPSAGKRFLRETKAFSRMQPWYAEDADGFDPGVREGWMEAGGFGLSPATMADLKALNPLPQSETNLRRALVLDRDGVPADPKLAAALEVGGAKVTTAPGQGWAGLVSHPEQAKLPLEVADRFQAWLEGEPFGEVPSQPAFSPVEATETIELESGEGRIRETAVSMRYDWGDTVAILAEPQAGASADLCAVFLNAGAVRSAGPNRLWVETARRWAGRGVSSVRIDLEGIGEADGKPAGPVRPGEFYLPQYGPQVKEVLDQLEARGVASRFYLVGLCAGGYWAFRTAVEEPRVVAGALLNGGALRWHNDLQARREARKSSRAFESRWWGKLLHGEIGAARLLRLLRSVLATGLNTLRRLAARPFQRRSAGPMIDGIETDLDSLRESQTRVLLAFSGEEPLGIEVEQDRLAERGDRWPNLEFAELPGSDHTLRPPVAQRAVASLLDHELEQVLGRSRSAV